MSFMSEKLCIQFALTLDRSNIQRQAKQSVKTENVARRSPKENFEFPKLTPQTGFMR